MAVIGLLVGSVAVRQLAGSSSVGASSLTRVGQFQADGSATFNATLAANGSATFGATLTATSADVSLGGAGQTKIVGGLGLQVATFGGTLAVPKIRAWVGDPNAHVTADVGSLCMDTATPAVWVNTNGASAWSRVGASTSATNGTYGDGADGTRTLDGAATILGMVPAANVYTAVRDLFLQGLTVNAGVTLNMNGYRLFVRGNLALAGKVSADGFPGSVNGFGGPGGVWSGGSITAIPVNGGGGTRNGAGQAGPSATAAPTFLTGTGGGAGGAGGANAGGAGGATSAAIPGRGDVRFMPNAVLGSWPNSPGNTITLGSGGGGGGAVDAGGAGGGGGTGGGWLVVVANTWSGAGSLSARGGAGSPANAGGTAAGGGGGGQGGVITFVSTSPTAPTVDVTGGGGGAGVAGGIAGGAGGPGYFIDLSNH